MLSHIKITYRAIGTIYCPLLKEDVFFNSDGLHHLRYHTDGTARTVSESIYKLTLFPLVIPVIKNAPSIAEKRIVRIKTGRKKSAHQKNGEMYALVAEVGKKPIAIRVILMRIGNGKLVFRSVMKN